jgi:hypothetical protein
MADDDDSSGWASSTSSTGPDSSSSSTWKKRASSAGAGLQAYGKSQSDRSAAIAESIRPVSYHTGGKVRSTGPAVLKRGERVIPASKRKKVERSMKREGMSLTNKKRSSKGREARGR